jgi:RimJ/RimL family protein N-acetyltransferase
VTADSLAALSPVTLDGRYLTLEPLAERHARDLFEVMQDEEVCRYLSWSPPKALDETLELIRQAEDQMNRRESVVFAQIWKASGRAIGSTRLLDVRPKDRQVEIGATFIGREHWRTPANTESKFLFLRYCFETLGCVRVALKTDGRKRALSSGDRAPGGRARGHLAQAHERARLSARHRVLLDPRHGVAAIRARLSARLYD